MAGIGRLPNDVPADLWCNDLFCSIECMHSQIVKCIANVQVSCTCWLCHSAMCCLRCKESDTGFDLLHLITTAHFTGCWSQVTVHLLAFSAAGCCGATISIALVVMQYLGPYFVEVCLQVRL